MDGGFDIDNEIARACASVSKPGTLIAAERDLAAKETEIAAIRAEIAELAALGKEDAAGRGRQRLAAALSEHGKLMNASQAARAGYYKRRAEGLRPVHQHGIDAIAQLVDLALPGATWAEVMASDRLRVLIAACNRVAVTLTTWTDRPTFILPMREEGLKNIVARHRSR